MASERDYILIETIKQISCLAAFIPVIMGVGGNVGIQSSTIVARGLAAGRIHIQDLWRVVLKEHCYFQLATYLLGI